MNKLMYRFAITRKKKKKKEKKEIDPFLDTVCPFRASRVTKALYMKAAHHPPYAPECYELTSSNVSSYNTGCVCVTYIGNTSSKTYTVEPNRVNNSLLQTQL